MAVESWRANYTTSGFRAVGGALTPVRCEARPRANGRTDPLLFAHGDHLSH
jgi:hypothetical protein